MIDSHCHLDFPDFDMDRDEVVRAAREAGVHTIVNIGVDLRTSQRSLELAEQYGCVYATVGVHPHDARSLDNATLDMFREMARRPKVVAVGEIGLDFYRDLSPRDVQRRAFRRQLDLAVELRKPIVIHTREAFRETVDIVKEYSGRLAGGVFHCFPGDVDEAHEVIGLGFVIGVGGVSTYRNSRLAAVAAAVPLDRIMLETDAPYLTPAPNRGKRNEPACVALVCRRVAELRGVTPAEVERATDLATRKLFGLVEMFGG